MTTVIARSDDEDVLRQGLERVLPEIARKRSAIVDLRRRRSSYSSSYASDIVTIRLDDGEELTVFLKDFGSCGQIKDEMERRREREMRVYRDLFAGADLGTPRYYGSVWDESLGRYWMFLEFVDGMPVRDCKVEYWVEAAGWLGRMQGYSKEKIVDFNDCDYLLRYDASYFRSKAEAARRAVSRISAPLADRLAGVLGRYERAVTVMADQPLTFVHGHYRPYNIVVTPGSEPTRICPVDWEVAGLGPPLYDFAFLAEGFKPQVMDRLGDAYREEAAGYGLRVPGRVELRYLADCYRLHRTMLLLGYSVDRKFQEKDVAKLIDLAHELGGRIF